MKSNYDTLGNHIRLIDTRNTDSVTDRVLGINIDKFFMPSVANVKEEQDFIDNTLIKYVEVLHDLDLIEDRFYAQIKYGTDDERTICLIKNGLSLSSAMLLIKKYAYAAAERQLDR